MNRQSFAAQDGGVVKLVGTCCDCNLRRGEVIGSGTEVNWRIDELGCYRLPSVDLSHGDLTGASNVQNNMAAISAEGSTVWS